MHTRRLFLCLLDCNGYHYTLPASHPWTDTVSCVFAPGVPVHTRRISSALLGLPPSQNTPYTPPMHS